MLAVTCIPIIILTLIAFILTRRVIVKLKKDDTFSLEVHFPIFAICLRKRNYGKTKRKKDKKRRSIYSYINMLSSLRRLLGGCDVTVNEISLPRKESDGIEKNTPRIFGYYSIASTILAYIDDCAGSLSVSENAFLEDRDHTSLCFDLSLETELFNLIRGFFEVKKQINRKR